MLEDRIVASVATMAAMIHFRTSLIASLEDNRDKADKTHQTAMMMIKGQVHFLARAAVVDASGHSVQALS